jgi:hypothetical protein
MDDERAAPRQRLTSQRPGYDVRWTNPTLPGPYSAYTLYKPSPYSDISRTRFDPKVLHQTTTDSALDPPRLARGDRGSWMLRSGHLLPNYRLSWQRVRHDIWARPIQQWRWSTTVTQRVAEMLGVGSAWREEEWRGFDGGSQGGLDVQGIERCGKRGYWSGLLGHRLPRVTLSGLRLSFRPTSDPGV